MYDLLLKNARVVDPLNNVDSNLDVAIKDGKIESVAAGIEESSKTTIDLKGKILIPGVIDMHTHMRTVLGHPHAQRMVALAGVCTTLDMAGPLDDIIGSVEKSGAGINIAVLEAARHPLTLSTNRPDKAERMALIERTLENGGIGIKLLGGHFPMDLDICAAFIEDSSELNSWVGWHVGNSEHGSNIEGLVDAVKVAEGKFLHVAHVNSYCRGQIKDEVLESQQAIDLLKKNPNLFSESYLSPLNGTRLSLNENGQASTNVTITCLKRFGYTPDRKGMTQAILDGNVGVLADNGLYGYLLKGEEGVKYWEEKGTNTTGSFAVNPATSRFLLAIAKRDNKSFVVDSFSTDGGTYPRNVIVENGLLLVKFGALTMKQFATKASLNGARALGLPNKGHLSVGADADITVIDFEKEKAYATIVGGKVIMKDGQLTGRGTCFICDERGSKNLKKKGLDFCVKESLNLKRIEDRFVP